MISISCPGGDYLLDRGLLSHCGELVYLRLKPQKVFILSDRNVFPKYGPRLIQSFGDINVELESMILPAGERSKNFENLEEILIRLSARDYSRSDVLIVLGGGVMGDLGGFAASCFKRGMKLVQIPSSLLAMVDSSVGGKTAVNLFNAKNQVGSFYQPSLIINDTNCLRSLPEREFRCGCGEIIKYAMLFDQELFDSLLSVPVSEQYEAVIEKCVRFKVDTVNKDERDTGCRQLLNFGHSFGHAVEALSRYEISHGEAVAIGMAMITRAAVKKGICESGTYERLINILDKYKLPHSCAYSPSAMFDFIKKDKKISGGRLNLIVPEKIGRCKILSSTPEEVYSWLISGEN